MQYEHQNEEAGQLLIKRRNRITRNLGRPRTLRHGTREAELEMSRNALVTKRYIAIEFSLTG